MVKKALIALAALIGLAYLVWDGGDSGGGGRGRLVPGGIGVDTPLAEAFQFGVAAA